MDDYDKYNISDNFSDEIIENESFDNKLNNQIPVVKSYDNGGFKKTIVLMCIICSVVGGLIGGLLTSFVIKNNDKAENAAETVNVTTNIYSETSTAKKETTTLNNSVETNIQSGIFTSSDDKPSDDKIYTAKEIYENNVESVVGIEVRNSYSVGYGTGFIISEKGYIVTNYHVVDGASECYVTLYDDSRYSAKIIGFEESNDIAVIKIEPENEIHSLVYGKSSDLCVGDSVYVIGNPLGDLTFTLTNGVVSALNRLIETQSGLTINMFQTNAAINSGNSGGPVFDEHGYVVGIASAKYASSSIEGLSFCIPIDDVRSMIDEIINNGYVSGKPLIGVSVCDREVATYGIFQSTKSINGAKIVAVGSGSAAEKYGLKVGDIIVAANGESVTSVSSLKTILTQFRSGDSINLRVNRNGSKVDITLVFDEYEPTQARTDYSYVYDL